MVPRPEHSALPRTDENPMIVFVVRFDNPEKAQEQQWRFRENLCDLQFVDRWPPRQEVLDDGVCELTFNFTPLNGSEIKTLPTILVLELMRAADVCGGGVQSISIGW